MPDHVVIDLARPEHLQQVLVQRGSSKLPLSACLERELRDDNEVILMIPSTIVAPRDVAALLDREIFVGLHRHYGGPKDKEVERRVAQLTEEIGATGKALDAWSSTRLSLVRLGDARADSYWGLGEIYWSPRFKGEFGVRHSVLL